MYFLKVKVLIIGHIIFFFLVSEGEVNDTGIKTNRIEHNLFAE